MTNIHKRYAEASLSMLCSSTLQQTECGKQVQLIIAVRESGCQSLYRRFRFAHANLLLLFVNACFFHGTYDKNTLFPSVFNSTVSRNVLWFFFIIQNQILFPTWILSSSLHTLESLTETSWAPPFQCVWFPHAYCCKYNSQNRRLFSWKALRLTLLSTCS